MTARNFSTVNRTRFSLFAVLFLAIWLFSPAWVGGQQNFGENVEKISPPATKFNPEKIPDLDQVSKDIIDKTNEFRQNEELKPVKSNPELTKTAKYFAEFMAGKDEYGHTADGNQPAERAKKHGYKYCIVTENIAYQFHSQGFATEELSDKFVQGWKDSSGHRKNMLDSDVTETGVAVAQSEETGYFYAVQMFGRPKADTIKFEIVNQSDVAIEYKVGDQTLNLPPMFTRTHQRCRPGELTFQWPDEKGPTLEPASGDRLVITRDQAGEFQVKKQ